MHQCHFLGQRGSTRHCATVISPFSLTFPRFDSHRTNPRIVNLLLALAPEQVLLEPPESESSRDKERQTSTYLIVSCHIFIPLHTQTGVKFEIDNITDLFWEQRPRLGCAGALFFKFYFDARAQSSSAIGLALNPHTHRHTHKYALVVSLVLHLCWLFRWNVYILLLLQNEDPS